MYLVIYLYMLCILVVNVMSLKTLALVVILKFKMKKKFMHVCMLPSAGRVRAFCNLRLQCLPYVR